MGTAPNGAGPITLPATVQTSPYLTLVRPDEPVPVVYRTDTLGPSHPVMSPRVTPASG